MHKEIPYSAFFLRILFTLISEFVYVAPDFRNHVFLLSNDYSKKCFPDIDHLICIQPEKKHVTK